MIRELTAIASIVSQIWNYTRYVAKHFRALYAVLALTFVVLMLEYLATSLMIPMAPTAAANSSPVTQAWTGFVVKLGLEPSIRVWLWLFFVVMVTRLLLGYGLAVLTTWLGKLVHEKLSEKVFGHILRREPLAQVYARSVGHYITMAGDDTFKSGTIISSLLQVLVGFFTSLVGMLVLYQYSPYAFAGLLLFLAFCSALLLPLLRRVLRVNSQSVKLSRELGTTFVESLNSLRSIRSLHVERFVTRTYGEQIHRYVRMLVEIDAIKSGIRAMPAILLLALAIVVMRPGQTVGATDAALFAGTIIVIRIFASLGQMVTAGSQLLTDIRAVKDINALTALGFDDRAGSAVGAHDRIRSLSLDNVTFSYGERGRMLERVSFEFEAGRIYAIIGASGSGKSTLADIVLGLTEPDSGSLNVNHSPDRLPAVRSRLMLVEQQPKIFSSSVKENLLMGLSATEEDLYSALQVVNMESTVRKLAQGLDTRLSYLGENFSGGQRQRLGIARALLRRPDVLILDEATSALDPETRVQVVAKLRARMRDGIIIFITHDEEIAALADEVLTIEKGADA
jgi:ATP-binding cassette subfamily B protein